VSSGEEAGLLVEEPISVFKGGSPLLEDIFSMCEATLQPIMEKSYCTVRYCLASDRLYRKLAKRASMYSKYIRGYIRGILMLSLRRERGVRSLSLSPDFL